MHFAYLTHTHTFLAGKYILLSIGTGTSTSTGELPQTPNRLAQFHGKHRVIPLNLTCPISTTILITSKRHKTYENIVCRNLQRCRNRAYYETIEILSYHTKHISTPCPFWLCFNYPLTCILIHRISRQKQKSWFLKVQAKRRHTP